MIRPLALVLLLSSTVCLAEEPAPAPPTTHKRKKHKVERPRPGTEAAGTIAEQPRPEETPRPGIVIPTPRPGRVRPPTAEPVEKPAHGESPTP